MPLKTNRALVVFFGLTAVLAGLAYRPIIQSGSFNVLGGNGLLALMWAPGIAGIATSIAVYGTLDRCGLGIGFRKLGWVVLGLMVPLGYTLLVYLPLGSLGIVELGSRNIALGYMTLGMWNALQTATGEEIGWRGFATPLMSQRFGFWRGNILIGAFWALYHYPALLFTPYGDSVSAIDIAAFSVTVTLLSIILGYSRERSGSQWPAAVFHAAHNLYFLHLFDPMKSLSPAAEFLRGETGILLPAVYVLLVGWVYWRRARDLKVNPS